MLSASIRFLSLIFPMLIKRVSFRRRASHPVLLSYPRWSLVKIVALVHLSAAPLALHSPLKGPFLTFGKPDGEYLFIHWFIILSWTHLRYLGWGFKLNESPSNLSQKESHVPVFLSRFSDQATPSSRFLIQWPPWNLLKPVRNLRPVYCLRMNTWLLFK